MKHVGVLLAGGSGTRMHSAIPKQFLPLCGKPVLAYTLQLFDRTEAIDEICLVVADAYRSEVERIACEFGIKKPIAYTSSGRTRTHSSYNAYVCCAGFDCETTFVIHDAARPLLSDRDLGSVLQALQYAEGVVLALRVVDTVYELSEVGNIVRIPDRSYLWKAQTPQAFRGDVLGNVYQKWLLLPDDLQQVYTDDISLVHALAPQTTLKIVEAQDFNAKLTDPTDFVIAEHFLSNNNEQTTFAK